jgi:hypothetical protein
MGRGVVIEVHRDHDSEKAADGWHTSDVLAGSGGTVHEDPSDRQLDVETQLGWLRMIGFEDGHR